METSIENESNITERGQAFLACPYCGEKDFDFIGLKGHFLSGDCQVFNDLPVCTRNYMDKYLRAKTSRRKSHPTTGESAPCEHNETVPVYNNLGHVRKCTSCCKYL